MTKDQIASARRRGCWTGGPVPLGYQVVDHKLAVNELEAVLVREIFSIYRERRSTLEVVRVLNGRHRETKRHRAASGRVREGRVWKTADVLRILRNPTMAGYVTTGDERHAGLHEPIVAYEEFARVQAILDSNLRPRRGRQVNPDYLLRGVLRCGACGAAYTPVSTTTARGSVHRYYRCSTREKQGTDACPSAPLPANTIEAAVLEHVRGVVSDGALAAETTTAVSARIAARRDVLAIERRELPGKISALSDEMRTVIELTADADAAARPGLRERLTKLGEQLGRAEAQLAAAERSWTHLEGVSVEVAWVAHCLADFDEIWASMDATNRGQLVRAVIDRVEVHRDRDEVTIEISLADRSTEIGAGAGDPPPSETQTLRSEATQ